MRKLFLFMIVVLLIPFLYLAYEQYWGDLNLGWDSSDGIEWEDSGAAPAGKKLLTVKHQGDASELAVPGGVTIVEFYGSWCPACRQIDPLIRKLAGSHRRLFVRKISVPNFKAEVLRVNGVSATPTFMVYDADGSLIFRGTSQTFKSMLYAIDDALKRGQA